LIRPFDLRDIPLMRQLESQSIVLDSRQALIRTHRPLQGALVAYLIAKRGTPTYVLRARQAGVALRAFGQLQLSPHPSAHLVALSAGPNGDGEAAWGPILDALTAFAGRCGAHALLAEVEDNSPHLEALRQANFTVYTRQEIWRLTQPIEAPGEPLLRPVQSSDAWHIHQLIANTVPRLIQQVETVQPAGQELVWLSEENLLAYVRAQSGPQGTWIQLYLHPQADDAIEPIIRQAVTHYPPSTQTPLYCCVRRYQEWLNRPLGELHFESLGSQAVMVRHTTVRLPQLEKQLLAVAEPGLEATSPMVHSNLE